MNKKIISLLIVFLVFGMSFGYGLTDEQKQTCLKAGIYDTATCERSVADTTNADTTDDASESSGGTTNSDTKKDTETSTKDPHNAQTTSATDSGSGSGQGAAAIVPLIEQLLSAYNPETLKKAEDKIEETVTETITEAAGDENTVKISITGEDSSTIKWGEGSGSLNEWGLSSCEIGDICKDGQPSVCVGKCQEFRKSSLCNEFGNGYSRLTTDNCACKYTSSELKGTCCNKETCSSCCSCCGVECKSQVNTVERAEKLCEAGVTKSDNVFVEKADLYTQMFKSGKGKGSCEVYFLPEDETIKYIKDCTTSQNVEGKYLSKQKTLIFISENCNIVSKNDKSMKIDFGNGCGVCKVSINGLFQSFENIESGTITLSVENPSHIVSADFLTCMESNYNFNGNVICAEAGAKVTYVDGSIPQVVGGKNVAFSPPSEDSSKGCSKLKIYSDGTQVWTDKNGNIYADPSKSVEMDLNGETVKVYANSKGEIGKYNEATDTITLKSGGVGLESNKGSVMTSSGNVEVGFGSSCTSGNCVSFGDSVTSNSVSGSEFTFSVKPGTAGAEKNNVFNMNGDASMTFSGNKVSNYKVSSNSAISQVIPGGKDDTLALRYDGGGVYMDNTEGIPSTLKSFTESSVYDGAKIEGSVNGGINKIDNLVENDELTSIKNNNGGMDVCEIGSTENSPFSFVKYMFRIFGFSILDVTGRAENNIISNNCVGISDLSNMVASADCKIGDKCTGSGPSTCCIYSATGGKQAICKKGVYVKDDNLDCYGV